MGQPSTQASNAIIYLTYGAFLIFGCYIAWRLRHQTKSEYLSGNRTQTAIPLALNFIASALGSAILFAYPQLATITGVQGVVIYAIASAAPLMIFAWLGQIIRRKCPDGFVLTEWTRQRYGIVTALYLSFLTLASLFLYMIAELSALYQIMNALTGMDGLPMLIVEGVVTTIYTSIGGFRVSFITDNIQGTMVILLLFVATIAIGVNSNIDRSLVDSSGLLSASLLGWQLLYILPVAILTNNFFLSNLWIRTFASKTDRDLWLGVSIAAVVVAVILALVGTTGLIAVWSGALTDIASDGSIALFILLDTLPAWVVGIVLILVVSLSTSAFDSFQSAMVSTASNDLFRNKLNMYLIRASVVLILIPVVIIALRAPNILQVYLISDLLSASTIPVLCLGLSDHFHLWRGFDVVAGGLGGILCVFIFGVIYLGDVQAAGNLLLLEGGLYANDWSVFGAFVCAPFGGLLCGGIAMAMRMTVKFMWTRFRGDGFHARERSSRQGIQDGDGDDAFDGEGGEQRVMEEHIVVRGNGDGDVKGSFF